MKRFTSAASLVLALVAVLGLAGSGAAGERVPFQGRLEGDVTSTPLVPPYLFVLVEATGNATHLGEFTLDIPHLVNRTTRAAVGFYQFTAANGDTVFAEFTGTATPTEDPDVLAIVEIATIKGGTGRFARASGRFTCERLFDTVAGTTAGSFKGTITDDDDGDDD